MSAGAMRAKHVQSAGWVRRSPALDFDVSVLWMVEVRRCLSAPSGLERWLPAWPFVFVGCAPSFSTSICSGADLEEAHDAASMRCSAW